MLFLQKERNYFDKKKEKGKKTKLKNKSKWILNIISTKSSNTSLPLSVFEAVCKSN